MYTFKVEYDIHPINPREFHDVTKFICFHKRYNLGDKHDYKADDYNSFAEMKQAIIKKEKPAVILPLYMYEHGGIALSTEPYSCRWDSGQIGFALIKKDSKRLTVKEKERLTNVLLACVEEYSQYLNGDVYMYTVYDENDDIVECVGGYYNEEDAEEGAKDMITYLENK